MRWRYCLTNSSNSPPFGVTLRIPLRNLWKPRAGRLTTRSLLVFDEPFFLVTAIVTGLAASVNVLAEWSVVRVAKIVR